MSQTMSTLLTASYTTQDAAFALQHGNFADFRRNLMRGEFLLLPRHSIPGRAGGEYRYGHILEMALQIHLGSTFTKEVAKTIIWGMLDRLKSNDTGLRKFNLLSREDKEAVMHGSEFSRDDDKFNLSWFVEFPMLVLGPDLVSRDAAKPTFFAFRPGHTHRKTPVLMLDGEANLQKVHAELVEMETRGAADDFTRQTLADACHVPGLVNLTAIMLRLEYLLSVRLRAAGPIGS